MKVTVEIYGIIEGTKESYTCFGLQPHQVAPVVDSYTSAMHIKAVNAAAIEMAGEAMDKLATAKYGYAEAEARIIGDNQFRVYVSVGEI